MSAYLKRTFWVATGERAISTAAQAAVALITAEATGLLEVDWAAIGGTAGMAAVLSVLKGLVAASPVIPGDGPSLVTAEQTSDAS